jgi:5-methyltetrahydrofolate--homocysteine methyltransferase
MESTRCQTLQRLIEAANQRILLLDGAMGTMIQQLGLDEDGFRGREFAGHGRDLKGCNDLLSATQPDAITAIHRAYLEAGADILSTNTFNANRISLADYGLSDHVRRINVAAVECARRAVEEWRGTGGQGEGEKGRRGEGERGR